jgi:hypothetical protein
MVIFERIIMDLFGINFYLFVVIVVVVVVVVVVVFIAVLLSIP